MTILRSVPLSCLLTFHTVVESTGTRRTRHYPRKDNKMYDTFLCNIKCTSKNLLVNIGIQYTCSRVEISLLLHFFCSQQIWPQTILTIYSPHNLTLFLKSFVKAQKTYLSLPQITLKSNQITPICLTRCSNSPLLLTRIVPKSARY